MTKNLQVTQLRVSGDKTLNFLHRGSEADLGVFQQMFVSQDYSLSRLKRGEEIRDFYRRLVSSGKTPAIVDAGANIGASACWFALEYPAAKIIAIEPDPDNFHLLKSNSAGLNVVPLNAAVASRAGRAKLHDPGMGEWGYRTFADDAGGCDMIAMSNLIGDEINAGCAPFIVKIDIEGGEQDLFSESYEWVESVPVLIVELHDWLLPKQGTALPFLQCISQYDRDFVYIGENIFSIQNEFPEP